MAKVNVYLLAADRAETTFNQVLGSLRANEFIPMEHAAFVTVDTKVFNDPHSPECISEIQKYFIEEGKRIYGCPVELVAIFSADKVFYKHPTYQIAISHDGEIMTLDEGIKNLQLQKFSKAIRN